MALYGGSFDPPHRGHGAVARAAADAYHLDEVVFTPTGLQPLKPGGASAAYADRLAMVSLLCAEDSRFRASDLDAPHADGTPNYTVDTLESLRREYLPSTQIFAIAGADSFLDFARWRSAPRLLELAEWIVVSRPGFRLPDISRGGDSDPLNCRVHLLTDVAEDISATELRRLLSHGSDCSAYVPEAVLAYIQDHELYKRPTPDSGVLLAR